ncbi:uncharacterized protein LY79DRAFT_552109 [Colletotrichum navitas]|uniref:Uncharacterized protein n=1 Tax=Colletotrichum navitas TaxID=681940 RepID=A0AAD8Q130_9PEZI|nr:uncharacterized protein LY79DRAFT_552109 [Colletotrichum navitas]KAK1593514.1 hypothetical protein LY79DRAFT_552109 [Colletotrichum navitas]
MEEGGYSRQCLRHGVAVVVVVVVVAVVVEWQVLVVIVVVVEAVAVIVVVIAVVVNVLLCVVLVGCVLLLLVASAPILALALALALASPNRVGARPGRRGLGRNESIDRWLPSWVDQSQLRSLAWRDTASSEAAGMRGAGRVWMDVLQVVYLVYICSVVVFQLFV